MSKMKIFSLIKNSIQDNKTILKILGCGSGCLSATLLGPALPEDTKNTIMANIGGGVRFLRYFTYKIEKVQS